jgi:hypothetical protein
MNNNKKKNIPEVVQELAVVYETKFAGQNTELEGYTLEEIIEEGDQIFSGFYGVDFHKIRRLRRSEELSEDEITEELLARPEFLYNPYPGFKCRQLPDDFVPDPDLLAAFSDELAEQ